MSETDTSTEPPHVSTEELRAALAPRGETRRNPVLVTEHADGELRSSAARSRPRTACAASSTPAAALIDSARADAIELRAALDAARGDAEGAPPGAHPRPRRGPRAPRRARPARQRRLFRRRKVMAELNQRNAF